MCGACGVLGGGPEWVDRVDNPDGVPHGKALTLVAERQRRIHLVNLLLEARHMRLRDFGRNLVLSGPTGRQEIVDSLRHVWMAADRMAPDGIDPLDPTLLRRLEDGLAR
jgi:hypothetical protein